MKAVILHDPGMIAFDKVGLQHKQVNLQFIVCGISEWY